MPAVLSKIRQWMKNVRDFFLRLLNRFLSFVQRKTKSDKPTFEDSETAPLINAADTEIDESGTTEVQKNAAAASEVGDQLKQATTPIVPDKLEQIVETGDDQLKEGIEVVKPGQEKHTAPNGDQQLEQTAEAEHGQISEAAVNQLKQTTPIVSDQLFVPEAGQQQSAEVFESEQQTEFFSPMSKTSNGTFKSCEPLESDYDFHTIRTGSLSTDKQTTNDDAVEDDEQDLSDGTWNAEDADRSSSPSSASEGSIHMGEEESSDEEDAMINESGDDDEYVGGDGSDGDDNVASKENDLIGNKQEFTDNPSTNNRSTSFRD
jgi:hypothetical protein